MVTSNHNSERVVLIHGLLGSRMDMWPIARRLRRDGFITDSLGYRSIGNDVRSIAASLAGTLTAIDNDPNISRWHLVTHSLGGIIARYLFDLHDFPRLRRLVMLAPPNQGSHAATMLAPYFRWMAPTLDELSDRSDSLVNQMSPRLELAHVQFGIVTAGRDRVIRRGRTALEGCVESVEVDGHHGILSWYPQTISYVSQFLRHGSFRTCTDSATPSAESDVPNLTNGTA